MRRKNSESLKEQREAMNRRIENKKNDSEIKKLEQDQIKNVYKNTLYFTVLSICFGLMYFYITIN
jgi:hypothetical protein|tara:strand:+ start:305 stop:499 length:195 start_codon:yes stop_codon:yes gene_type:complete